MDSRFWQDHLDRCPALRPWLERAARVAVRRPQMPASLTLGEVPRDRAVRQALEALFGPCREMGGRWVARLDGASRERDRWLPLAALLGLEVPPENGTPTATDRLAQAVRRLKLLHPAELQLVERLRESEALRRFCGASESAERELSELFDALAVLRDMPDGITLSELGARCCNDSKALRAGRLRQALEHLLRLRLDAQDEPERDVFAEAGIVDNPLTTQATAFAPFAYRTIDGEWLDWPYRLWLRGEAAVFPWQTLRAVAAVRFEQPCAEVVTSENAAPFLRLVERRTAAVYTGGYPNAAVRALLARLAEAGATARHWGDTDLDGYRIAEQVGLCIPAQLHALSGTTPRSRFRPLDDVQRRRAERFLAAHPGFRYRAEVRQTLDAGWLEQENGRC
jgi:hypothetical protein